MGRICIFSGKIGINLYHFNIPHAKHRNNARNTVLLFSTGTHKIKTNILNIVAQINQRVYCVAVLMTPGSPHVR